MGAVSSVTEEDATQEGRAVTRPLTTPEIVLQMRGLTKSYGKHFVVSCLDIDVGRGEIFGLLGPAGSGKTTTLRMIVNLVKPTLGEVKLFGESVEEKANKVLPRVGTMLAKPSFQGYLNAYDNLAVLASYTGGVGRERIAEVLNIVGLQEVAKQRYASYAQDTRQRLALGAALLTDPELLLLDEPWQNLDEASSAELQVLLRHLAQEGKTIVIASRSLPEIRRCCNRLAVIRSGIIHAYGRVQDVLIAADYWEIEVNKAEEVAELLAKMPVTQAVKVEGNHVLLRAPALRGRDLLYYLAHHGIWPESVHHREERDIQQLFLRLLHQEKKEK